MNHRQPDAIVVGSGAGGAAVAYRLALAGRHVLMLEKGGRLPRDGSTLDVKAVFAEGRFKNKREWQDGHGKRFVPDEYYNVGGKTKWYGAALLRFSEHEFQPDPPFACRGWPIGYADLAPYYDEAEELLHVNRFEHEPELEKLIERICAADEGWQPGALPLGLKKAILDDENEAKHFDGFASACGYKSDAEWNLLDTLADRPNFRLVTDREAVDLLHADDDATRIGGVRCADGSEYRAPVVILAAGAMTTPRIVQTYLARAGLTEALPSAINVGTNFKYHLNSALLGFSPFRKHDVLRKTAIFLNERFPHSSVQCLGWMDGEILATQLPQAVPTFVSKEAGSRAYGFFITTEDGSHRDNRIRHGDDGTPVMAYDLARIPESEREHKGVVKAFTHALVHAGMAGVSRYMGLAGTAHALGSMVTGDDPADSVVDRHGSVHGMTGLYVADGSVLPRSSRVNPALTIYAWGLRLGEHLA